MFRIDIYSDKEGHFWLEKETQAEVDEYVTWCKESQHWGHDGYEVIIKDKILAWTETIPAKEAVLDEQGNVIEPAVPEQIIEHPEIPEVKEWVPATYRLEISDIAKEKKQKKINAESLAYLSETDWYVLREVEGGKKMPPEIKKKRQECRDAIKRS